jgi:type I restriction enzyme S subunit
MFARQDTAKTIRFGDVTQLVAGRNLVADDLKIASDYRVLKISAVTSGTYLASESKPLPVDYIQPETHMVRRGDLLMSRANTAELVGAVAYVANTPSNMALPDKIWRFQWRESGSDPLFYQALLQSPSIRRHISKMASGTGGSMKNLAKAKLETLELPAVDFKRQREFASHVKQIDAHRATVQRALAADDELFASLQSRAFRGEL